MKIANHKIFYFLFFFLFIHLFRLHAEEVCAPLNIPQESDFVFKISKIKSDESCGEQKIKMMITKLKGQIFILQPKDPSSLPSPNPPAKAYEYGH